MTTTTRPLAHRIASVVQRAALAPSVHNTQPWHFELTEDALVLHADRTRQLAVLDPTGRQLTISCGCALFNARLALAHDKIPVRVRLWPDGERSLTLARLEFCAADDPQADVPVPADRLTALHAAIEVRQTNRRRFTDQPVPRAVIDLLELSARTEHALLSEVRGDDDRVVLAQLSQRADAMQYADPAYRAELRAWTTTEPDRRDGVPPRAVPHVDAGSGDEIPIRDFDSQGQGFLPTQTASTRNQCLLLLGTESDTPQAWLAAGQALERMLLEITHAGLSASPLTQVVEVPSARAELRLHLRLLMQPHVLLRVGYADRTPSTPRRRIDDVLDVHGPA